VLAGDGADQEEAETGALDLDCVAAGDSVEAFEDAFEVVGCKTEAVVRDGEGDLRVAEDGDGTEDVDAMGRILYRVVENVEDGGAKVFGDGADVETDAEGNRRELDRVGKGVYAVTPLSPASLNPGMMCSP